MILYFSGTGNSRHVAKRMAAELDDQLLDLNERIKAEDTSPVETGEDLVVVTPTGLCRAITTFFSGRRTRSPSRHTTSLSDTLEPIPAI